MYALSNKVKTLLVLFAAFLVIGLFSNSAEEYLQKENRHMEIALEMKNIIDFFDYVETPTRKCHNPKVFGGRYYKAQGKTLMDGGKVVCLDESLGMSPQNCLLYSFGINNDWSFDDSLARYGCQIYAYDPTMNAIDHKRGDKITYYNTGISNKDQEVMIGKKMCKVKRFTNIMEQNGHLKDNLCIDYLKMDVEGAEIPFLQDMLGNYSHILKKIKQIGMEIHPGRYSPSRLDLFKKHYTLFKLVDNLGFKIFSTRKHQNPAHTYYLKEVGRHVSNYYEVVWGLWPDSEQQ